jgi:hypothetical protein
VIIVFWQRYPSDPISRRSFEDEAVTARFVYMKESDYRYSLGRVWSEHYAKVTRTPPQEGQ